MSGRERRGIGRGGVGRGSSGRGHKGRGARRDPAPTRPAERGTRSEKRPVLEAAAVGHRITHDDVPAPRQLLIVAARWGAGEVAKQHGDAPLLSALLGTAMSSLERALGRDDDGDRNECPDPCGTIEHGSENTFIGVDKRAAAIVDPEVEVPCDEDSDGPIAMGAAHVWVNAKRWARRSDELDCGARVGEGDPTIFIGAPAEGRATRVPSDPKSWIDQNVVAAMLSSGRFGELGDGLGSYLGGVLGGAAPPRARRGRRPSRRPDPPR